MPKSGEVVRESVDGLFRCYVCKRLLQSHAFIAIVRQDPRCKPGHEYRALTSDCNDRRNYA